ncbi:MAG: hypothetical protein ACRC5H_06340 [Treponemataceae bacterium]
MFCNNCGKKIEEEKILCSSCETNAFERQCKNSELLFKDPINGVFSVKTFSVDDIKNINDECKTTYEYESIIDNYEMNPALKDFFKGLIGKTVKMGNLVLKIGKWLINVALKLLSEIAISYPNTVIHALFGFIAGILLSSIPILGWLLGPFIVPIFTVFGGMTGLLLDCQNKINNDKIVNMIKSGIFATAL